MIEKLPGDYIAGFVDGEGCFALNIRRDVRHERKNAPIYFSWKVEFAIVLTIRDMGILEKIQSTLECGKVNATPEKEYVRYNVANNEDLINNIIPFFEKYPLRAKKKFDFDLWKEAVILIYKNQRKKINTIKGSNGFQKTIWDENDLKRLKEIKIEMKKYKGIASRGKWLTNNT